MKSFKQMIKDGEIKRHDAMKVQLDDIHEEPGFNLRIEGAELQESINQLAEFIMGGGQPPALEVRPREGGGVFLVDGHRRRRAFLLARERGAPIEWINVVAFTGNDADRVARVITSAEGRPLQPMEMALGCKRLAAFGLSNAEIAAKIGKTPQRVAQLLDLSNANTDVQQMVAAGGVSATEATKVVREHGEKAGDVLREAAERAKADGKKKVTAKALKEAKPKQLPAGVAKELEASALALEAELPTATRMELQHGINNGVTSIANVMVQVPAGFLLELVLAVQDVKNHYGEQAAKELSEQAKAKQQPLEV